jgi:hypothetical protein
VYNLNKFNKLMETEFSSYKYNSENNSTFNGASDNGCCVAFNLGDNTENASSTTTSETLGEGNFFVLSIDQNFPGNETFNFDLFLTKIEKIDSFIFSDSLPVGSFFVESRSTKSETLHLLKRRLSRKGIESFVDESKSKFFICDKDQRF